MADDETPWAMVQRLQSEGAAAETIVERLGERGLPPDDIELLLRGVPGFSAAQLPSRAAVGPTPREAFAEGADFDAGEAMRGTMWFLVLCLAWLAGIVAIVSGLCLFYVPVSWELLATLGTTSVVCALSTWGYLGSKSRREVLPNLAERVPSQALCEIDGVQFTASTASAGARRGKSFPVVFLLQSCVNRGRHVTFRFASDGAKAGPGGTIPSTQAWSFPKEATGLLRAGEIAELTVWVRPGPDTAGVLPLWVEPRSEGPLARRVRYLEAKPYQRRVTDAETVAGVALLVVAPFGVITYGGGYRVNVHLSGEPTDVDVGPLPAPEWKVVWAPTPEQLAVASGRSPAGGA